LRARNGTFRKNKTGCLKVAGSLAGRGSGFRGISPHESGTTGKQGMVCRFGAVTWPNEQDIAPETLMNEMEICEHEG
jgi:hypothetical protein